MIDFLLGVYRSLPLFKGKLRVGKVLFGKFTDKNHPLTFKAHYNVNYAIPNTLENIGVELLINGVYEKETIDFLKEKINADAVYFDVGANIGSLALPVIKAKSGIRYYGFEASPMVFEFLKKNMEINSISNFKIENKLVHRDSDQEMKFFQSELYGKSSLSPTYTNDFIQVTSISLDKYLEEHKIEQIDWLKVDVQGFELNVFEGAVNSLKNKKIKNILFECEDWAEDQANIPRGKAREYLVELGFELWDFNGKKWVQDQSEKNTMIWARI
jgi:FkbM family methyltransferase